jgi:16S rRNA (uracil1498-N3)-methyltransferase
MHRFIVSPSALDQPTLTLDAGDSHHAAVVLRVLAGETVQLLDGRGGVADARVLEVAKRAVVVQVMERRKAPPRTGEVFLVAAVTKGRAWELMLQKATEVDVAAIVPILSRRCVVKVDRNERRDRQMDWQRTINEAAKQCGTPWIPRVAEPVGFDEWLDRPLPFDLGLVAALVPGSREIGELLDEHPSFRRVGVVVGPEGDFDALELQRLFDHGILPATLGPTVLRAETAAVVAVALVAYELRRRRTSVL